MFFFVITKNFKGETLTGNLALVKNQIGLKMKNFKGVHKKPINHFGYGPCFI